VFVLLGKIFSIIVLRLLGFVNRSFNGAKKNFEKIQKNTCKV